MIGSEAWGAAATNPLGAAAGAEAAAESQVAGLPFGTGSGASKAGVASG